MFKLLLVILDTYLLILQKIDDFHETSWYRNELKAPALSQKRLGSLGGPVEWGLNIIQAPFIKSLCPTIVKFY